MTTPTMFPPGSDAGRSGPDQSGGGGVAAPAPPPANSLTAAVSATR